MMISAQSTQNIAGLIGSFPVPDWDDCYSLPPLPEKKISRAQSAVFNVNLASYITNPVLPVIYLDDSIPRISSATMADLLSGKYDYLNKKIYIFDCRFWYEFENGHLSKAQQITSPEMLHDIFFREIQTDVIIIFHCEFSSERGPSYAKIFRQMDRNKNEVRYPYLDYPDIYILDGGFSEFYARYPEHCVGKYIKMRDPKYADECAKLNSQFKLYVKRYMRSNCLIKSQCIHSTSLLASPVARNRVRRSVGTL